jgi:predicted DNA-binding protein
MKKKTPPKSPKKLCAFRLSLDTRRRLKRAAKREGKTETQLLENAVRAFLPMFLKPVKRGKEV